MPSRSRLSGIFFHARNEITAGDTYRHAPIGEEIHPDDRSLNVRGLAVWPARNHAVTLVHLVLLDSLQLEGRRVDQYVAVVDAGR